MTSYEIIKFRAMQQLIDNQINNLLLKVSGRHF